MRAERREIRRLLEGLTVEQWHAASLCDGWTVRDLVAHLVAWDDLLIYRTPRQHRRLLVRFLELYTRSGASMARLNRHLYDRTRPLTPDDLLRRFARDDDPDMKWLFDGSNPEAHLAEYVIHRHDLARPLDLACDVPPERMIAALNGAMKLPSVRLRARSLLLHKKLHATDLDWNRGRGSRIDARADVILMALAGRDTIG
jgi:uncharacterized protein (TIGR03083 family)